MKKDYSFISEMPEGEYDTLARSGKHLTSQLIGDLRVCPYMYKLRIDGKIEPEDNSGMPLKRAFQTLLLGGRKQFDKEYLVSSGPVNPETCKAYGTRTRAYATWAAKQKRKIMSEREFAFLSKRQKTVLDHSVAKALLKEGRAGGVIRRKMNGESCLVRMDWFNPDYDGKPAIVEIKETKNLACFKYVATKLCYHHRLAFVRDVFHAAGRVQPDVYIIVIEERAPYRCGVWQLSDVLLDRASVMNQAAMAQLKACRKTNTWPTLFEDLQILGA